MTAPHGLDACFAPRGIAVIGAAPEPGRVGGRALAVLDMVGYRGAVHAVNPNHRVLQGRACYASVLEVPDPVDLAVIALGAARVPDAVRNCGKRGIAAAVVFADGFGPALAADLRAAIGQARAACGLRVIGPNSVGTRRVDTAAYASFAADVVGPEPAGGVAMISQSGGLGVYFGSALLHRRSLAARYVIDTGGEADVDAADCLEHLAGDPAVTCIALLLEGCRDGRRLAAAVRAAVAGGTPVVFFKTGRSRAGARQVASHTGALAGSAALFDAALREAGAHVARDEIELMDAIVLAASRKVPKGRRLGVVTPSGGYGILTLDAAEQFGLEVPEPAVPPTAEQAGQLAHGHFGNPLDFSSTISAGPKAVETSLAWMASQPNVDAVLLWQAYSAVRRDRQASLGPILARVVAGTEKPVFGCGLTTPEFEAHLRDLGVLWFEEPTRLVRALGVVAPRAPAALPVPASPPAGRPVVGGAAARAVLAGLPGLTHVATFPAPTVEAACAAQQALGGRIMLKVESDRHAHKTELGFVAGPLGPDQIAAAHEALRRARDAAGEPEAPIVLQPFERGTELALGAWRDPVFGPSVMVASGGIFLEVLRDTAFAPAPVSPAQAREMILRLAGAALLCGARGRPHADIDAAAAALAALSRFIAEDPGRWSEIDINPLIVRPQGEGAVAVDALLVPVSDG